MTAQEIIQNAQLRSSDTNPSGRTLVEYLSYLSSYYKALYDFIVKNDINNVSGFEKIRLSFSPSNGVYALPSDHLHTSKVWSSAFRVEIDYLDYSILENMYASFDPVGVKYSIYNGNWCFKPDNPGTIIAYYYPVLATLTLSTTWPGNGELDNSAIEFITNNVLLNDRFNKYDISIEAQTLAASTIRARYALLRSDPKVRILKCPMWSYANAREQL